MKPEHINYYGTWVTFWLKLILLVMAGLMMLFQAWIPCVIFGLLGIGLDWENDGRWFPRFFRNETE